MIMFENYPKKRIELPGAFQKIYSEHYKKNRDGATTASSLAQKMEVWLHKKVAADVIKNPNKSTLEIGAGTLNQLKYEQTKPYDIIEPFKELYSGSSLIKDVRNIFSDIDEIDLSNKYDRIISIATFEHITDLPKVVAKTCLLLNDNGSLRISIPNEGHFLWTLGWKATTGLEFKIKYGLDYGILMKYEHVNNADEIEEVLKYFYKSTSCSFFGISKNISLYRYYECTEPNIERAKEYLKK
jgi:SAM-dependent methyltransferase